MTYPWGDVDGSDDPAALIACQRTLERWHAISRYRARMRELTGRERVLDVGCGPGGETTYVGVDASMSMARTAASRGRAVVVADAAALPFRDRQFDAVRADRLFQHLVDPRRVLRELIRVLRPGGRLVVADPDQSTLVVDAAGHPLAERIVAYRRTHVRQPDLAHRLPALLAWAGLVDLTMDGFPLVLTDPSEAFGITTWARTLEEAGDVTDEECASWEAALRAGPFVYALTYFVVSARRGGAPAKTGGR